VAQSKFNRQSVRDGWSRDTEGASYQIGVGTRDDHSRSVGSPLCPCRCTSVYQVAEVRRRCCGPHRAVTVILYVIRCLTGSQWSDLSSRSMQQASVSASSTLADDPRQVILNTLKFVKCCLRCAATEGRCTSQIWSNVSKMSFWRTSCVVFRPNRLHTVHEMRPIATVVARSVVCVSVGHTGELCKNG